MCFIFIVIFIFIIMNKDYIDSREIILEVSLSLNRELFNENKISYKVFKYTENNILRELDKLNNK